MEVLARTYTNFDNYTTQSKCLQGILESPCLSVYPSMCPPEYKILVSVKALWGKGYQVTFSDNSSYTPAKQMFLEVYWNQPVCVSSIVCVSVYLSVYKILVSVKVLAGLLSHT